MNGIGYLIVNDYILDKVLDTTIEITSIEKFDNTKVLIDKFNFKLINYQMLLT